MRNDLIEWAARHDGVITRRAALARAHAHVLEDLVTAGGLVRVAPQVFVLRERCEDTRTLDVAALAYGGDGAALSHTTGLRCWRFAVAVEPLRHVTTGRGRQLHHAPRLVAGHRVAGFRVGAPMTSVIDGLRLASVEDCLVAGWPLLPDDRRRSMLLELVRSRRTTTALVRASMARHSRTSGAADIEVMCRLADEGCQSLLEWFGHARVFVHPSLPKAALQFRVAVNGQTYFLDRAYLPEKVGVELDGAAHHGSPSQREADLKRDAHLAAAGWVIVRFSYADLVRDPDGCRRRLLAVLVARRAQLAS